MNKNLISNMKNILARIDKMLRTRIRVIIWKQWKKAKTRCEALVKFGMPFELAYNCAIQEKALSRYAKRDIYNLLSIMTG